MFFKKYAEFTVEVPHSIDFMRKRLQKRSLSWKSWRNYFAADDNRIDFSFSERGKYIVLYPVCSNRNSMRGQFFLEFEPVSNGNTLIHVSVQSPDFSLFFIIWFGGTAIFTISSLFSCNRIGAAGGTAMILFAAILLYFMNQSAVNELDNNIAAFKNFISDDYIRNK